MEAGELIPLGRAAALVYARLFPGESVKDAKTLDLIAVAISAAVPLYQQEAEKGPLRALEEAEIANGRFTRGAMRLEFADGRAPLRFLLVPRAALYAALDAIANGPTCLTLRSSRRPPPGRSSATAA